MKERTDIQKHRDKQALKNRHRWELYVTDEEKEVVKLTIKRMRKGA